MAKRKTESSVDEPPKKRRDPAKEKLWDHTRKERQADIRRRRDEAARAAGFKSASDLLTQLTKDPALQDLIRNRKV